MWFILQSSIIFGVFCWIGQYVDYVADPEAKRGAGGIGMLTAYAVTIAIVYGREALNRWLSRL